MHTDATDDTADLERAYHMSEYPRLGISLYDALHTPHLCAGLRARAMVMHRQRTIAAARCHSWFDHCAERDEQHRASMTEFRAATGVSQ